MAELVYNGVSNVLFIDFSDKNTLISTITVLALLGISLLFRVLIGLGYYTSLSAFVLFAKKIERKEDIKSTPSLLINRCVAEYIECGENGSPLLGIEAIVNKNLTRMGFFCVSYKTVERFCVSLEKAALVIVLPVVLLVDDASLLLLFGAAYLVYRIILLFFDSNALHDKLFYSLTTHINKELGRFYIADDKSGLRVFKNEIHTALMEQASILQNSINNLTASVTETTKNSLGSMQNYMGDVFNAYDNLGKTLKEPVEKFGSLFLSFNKAAEAMNVSSEKLYSNVFLMNEKLSVITDSLEKNTDISAKNMERTSVVFDEISSNLKCFNLAYKSLEAEVSAVKEIQAILDESVRSYEQALQKHVVDFGDAIGKIAEYKGKEAADTLNETLSKHIIQFQSDTAKLLEKMAALFDAAYQQNKSEIQVLYRLEDLIKNSK